MFKNLIILLSVAAVIALVLHNFNFRKKVKFEVELNVEPKNAIEGARP